MTISVYQVLEADSPEKLRVLVQARVTAGDEPWGSMFVADTKQGRKYYQPVVTGSAAGSASSLALLDGIQKVA